MSKTEYKGVQEKRKVIHIITGLRAHGAELMLLRLLNAMHNPKISNLVISLEGPGDISKNFLDQGICLYILNFRQKSFLKFIRELSKLREVVKKERPDIIQGWMYHGNIFASLCRIWATDKCAVNWNVRHSIHDSKKESFKLKVLIFISRLISKILPGKILYNSLASAQQHEKLGFSKIRRKFIGNGFDCVRFSYSEEAGNKFRKKFNIEAKELVIGNIGRYHPMKNHKGFLEACALINREMPNVCIILAGKGISSGNMELVRVIKEYELSDKVILLGEVQDLVELYSAMDVMVSASSWGEGFPNVIGEAMAMKVPCVATDVGDSSVLLGDYGSVVSPNSPKELAMACLSLLRKTRQERLKIGESLRGVVLSRYSIDVISGEYEALYLSQMSN